MITCINAHVKVLNAKGDLIFHNIQSDQIQLAELLFNITSDIVKNVQTHDMLFNYLAPQVQ